MMAPLIGILPAAGSGSRLQPFFGAKELLPVGYRRGPDGTLVPMFVIEHSLAAMRAAHVSQCIVIISDQKVDLVRCLGSGASSGLRLAYVVQPRPLGLAHAVDQACAGMAGLDCHFVLALPDTVFEPRDALETLHATLVSERADLVLGLFPTGSPCELGPVRVGTDGRVVSVYDKPRETDLSNTWALAVWNTAFTGLIRNRVEQAGEQDVPLGTLFDAAVREGLAVRAVSFAGGTFHDVGTPRGIARLIGDSRPSPRAARRTTARHLVVAVHDRSWGRTQMARHVASELARGGERVAFLIHASMPAPAGFEYEVVADHVGRLNRVILDNCVRRLKPTSVIYFDYFSTANFFTRMGARSTDFLAEYDCPTITLDTWDFARTGHRIDLVGNTEASFILGDVARTVAAFDRVKHRLIPVPLAPCDGSAGQFSCLPRVSGRQKRRRARQLLGLDDRAQAIFLCTAKWQHDCAQHEEVQRISVLVPRLIAKCVRRLPESVHLVHIGPQPFPLGEVLGDRYRWLPGQTPRDFETLMHGCDLLLSPNVSATTIALAIRLKIPVLVATNSRTSGETQPFALWPLGYHRFVRPLLAGNKYCDAFRSAEVFDDQALLESCTSLLQDRAARESLIDQQAQYERAVEALPSAGDLVRRYASAAPVSLR